MTVTHEPPTEQMLTVKDVADALSISVRSVWRWTAVGKIPPPIKLGHHAARWRASDIQQLLDATSVKPPSEKRE
jgi:predicted DNA-binding transcriptional regulator AlpA